MSLPAVNPVRAVSKVNKVHPAAGVVTLLTALTLLTAAAPAESLSVLQSSFAGGELSPLASARLDAARYYQSAATLENMVPLPQGPAVRRPGTIFAAATDANNLARLLPFRYSTTDCYVLEFTDNRMRVFRNHGLVTTGGGSIYTLTTPFDGNELANLQVWQSADVLYMVDGNDWPQKLVRLAHDHWDINDAAIDDGPFLPENDTAATVAASGTTGAVTVTASTPIFAAGHVGSYWRIRELRASQAAAALLVAAGTGTATLDCQADEQFQWNVFGTFGGTMELQLSYDGGVTWTMYSTVTSVSAVQTTETVYTNDTGQDVKLRAWCTWYASGTIGVTLWTHAYIHTGVVKVTGYTDPCNVSATVVRTLASTNPTFRYSEGCWSAYRGFPRALGSYSDRLVLAGTTHQPLTVWMSATGDYERFDTATGDDDDSFGYTLGRSEQDPILWIAPQRRRGLLFGTTGAVLEIEPLDVTLAITPGNPPTVSNTLALPCSAVPPLLADNTLMVLQRQGRKVHELLYSYEADSLVAPDLTLFAEHITGAGLTALAWTHQPYTILWGARTDGQLAALTYDRNYQVVAWSRQILGGAGVVESLCSIPGTTDDELWLEVRRTIDSNTVRYVEYLAAWDFGSDPCDAYFVDAGLSYDAAPATTFSGLGHLEGASAAVLADGAPVAGKTVAGGAVTLSPSASVVHIGLAYTSTLQTVRYDFAGPTGTTWARRKTVPKATVSFYRTLGAEVGPDTNHLIEPPWQEAGAVLYAGVPDLFTGDREVSLATSYETDHNQLLIRQTQPWPLTVRALAATVEVK